MPVRLHHIVVDAHDLPGLARFWTRALSWEILSERASEIVIGTGENGRRHERTFVACRNWHHLAWRHQ
jgi:hypothetical protein